MKRGMKVICPLIERVKVDFFGHKVWINKRYKINLILAKSNIMLNYPLAINKIKRMDSYNCRYVRGFELQKIISYHGYGQATDINPSDYPSVRLKDRYGNIIGQRYDLPFWLTEVAECFKQAGFRWGGDWNTLFDPMHFEIGTRTV